MAADKIIELNIGGTYYATSLGTLTKHPNSRLAKMFDGTSHLPKDNQGRYFIDRDGHLFRYILDYLRQDNLVLPEIFHEKARLRAEAVYFELEGLTQQFDDIFITNALTKQGPPSVVTVGYRGTFAFGRDGLADVKFRKLARILVCGRGSVCRDVFGDTLNDSRDPDRGADDRYSSRFFLKHCVLEQAFDMLYAAGFEMTGSCGAGTNSSGVEIKPGQDSEENKWQHYNEFVFVKKI